MMHVVDRRTPLGRRVSVISQYPGKRTCDVLFAILILAILSPIMICITFLVKVTSRGPIFYKDNRLGRGGKVYRMLKFRTMKHGSLPILNSKDKIIVEKSDYRLTPVGRFLRALHLDEIPQLINVLKGEMSFIGPRSGQPEFEANYSDKAYERLSVYPGITGLGAVLGGRYLTNESLYSVEVAYVKQTAPFLDLKILILTPVYVLLGPSIVRKLLARYLEDVKFEYLEKSDEI